MQKRRTDVELYCDQINAANIVSEVSCAAERVLAECAERCGRQDTAQRIKQRMYDECTVLDWGITLLGDYIDSQTLTLDELAYDFAVAQMALCVVLDAYGEATELLDASPSFSSDAESEIERLEKENAVLEDRVGDYASELEEAYTTMAEANRLLRQTHRKLEEARSERDEVVSMLIGLHRAYAEAVGGGCDD